jgi:hypothetical protein
LWHQPVARRCGPGRRRKLLAARTREIPIPYLSAFAKATSRNPAARAKAAWAKLIRKVYEVDPLECPRCKGPMRVIALIEEPEVIRSILAHLGLWQPEPPRAFERAPPRADERARLPVAELTYHPIPDIA